MKKTIILLMTLFLSGCASSFYASTFNNAVKNGESTAIISPEPFKDLNKRLYTGLESLGYSQAIYVSGDEGFFVTTKKIGIAKAIVGGSTASHQIMVKLTNIEGGMVRIDLVNGGTYMFARREVAHDIEDLIAVLSYEAEAIVSVA